MKSTTTQKNAFYSNNIRSLRHVNQEKSEEFYLLGYSTTGRETPCDAVPMVTQTTAKPSQAACLHPT
jgi:hypothetical protein